MSTPTKVFRKLDGLVSAMVFSLPALSAQTANAPPFRDSNLAPDARAVDLVGRLTLEEKALQMQNAAWPLSG